LNALPACAGEPAALTGIVVSAPAIINRYFCFAAAIRNGPACMYEMLIATAWKSLA